MHFEIFAEDQSGKKALDVLIPRIISKEHTFNVRSYKGIGKIPKRGTDRDISKGRLLLNKLPGLLRGYGKTYAQTPVEARPAFIVVCDLDDKCLKSFRQELLGVLSDCNPGLETRFCIAIEEGEAWLLGDCAAVKEAYPQAKDAVLSAYVNDSICGTWECLADAVYAGGASALRNSGWQAVGHEKSRWAESIAPLMNVVNNKSASFCYFRDKMYELAGVVRE